MADLTKITREYRDLDLNFIPHPSNGDISTLKDEAAIKRALKNLVLTNFYERPFQPEVGTGLRRLLFEPMTPSLTLDIRDYIDQAIKKYEPRVKIKHIDVVPNYEKGEYEIDINFTTINILDPVSTKIYLKRVR